MLAHHSWSSSLRQIRSFSPTKKLAIRGAVWTITGFGASQILRFITSLIMTRLLFPELFGLMALVQSLILGLALFSDVGLGTSIVRHQRGDDPDFLNSVWTVQTLRGLVLWLGCIVLAFPAAQLYAEPRLEWLLPLVGLNVLIGGFNSTAIFTLQRRLAAGQLTAFELLGQGIATSVTLGWAYFNPSIWALIAGSFALSLFQLVSSHWINPGQPNRFAWNKDAISEVTSFGKWIFVSTSLTFLASQADRLILAKLFSLEFLGVYAIAFALADIPRAILGALATKIIFPTFSTMAGLPRAEFQAKIQRNRGPLVAALAIGLALLAGLGDYAVLILYDHRYADACWMLPLLALGLWPAMLSYTSDPALIVVGKPHFNAIGSLLSFVTQASGIALGAFFFGPLGAILGIALKNVPSYFVVAYGLWREGLACLRQDLWATVLFGAILAAIYAGRVALSLGLPPLTIDQ